MNIFLFGAQGSGKSTVGKYIAEKLSVPFVATGDIFRRLEQEDSELGREVKSLIDQGNLVPDDITMEIVNSRLGQKDTQNGFILDGVPRNLNQEKLIEKKPNLLILVNLQEKEALKRLRERARHDDTDEAIRRRLAWYKEMTAPVLDFYKREGVKLVEIDNTPPEAQVQKVLDGLFED